MSRTSQPTVTIAALGDLMLTGEWTEYQRTGQLVTALGDLNSLGKNTDLLFSNLEVTLPGSDGEIEKQPRLVGSAETISEALSILEVDVVNLSNNHTFDCFESGFEAVCDLLSSGDLDFLGAGPDASSASRPLIVERNGIRLGWLAYTALDTVPSHVAGADRYGVNAFEIEKAVSDIEALEPEVHHVLVSVHWGVEFSNLPSPEQVWQARRMIEAGAIAVLGHHAHVVQGVERYLDGLIVYNLGNAATTDLEIDGRLAIRQTDRSRSSFVVELRLTESKLLGFETRAFRFANGRITLGDSVAERYLSAANAAICNGVSEAQWRRRRLVEDVLLRSARKLNPRVIGSIRATHVAKVFRNLARALRGQGPA
ncbi:MAG: CapA family protein [Thermoanaerobaculia bacterium]